MKKIRQLLKIARENGCDMNRIQKCLWNIRIGTPPEFREKAQITYLEGQDYMCRPITG